MKINLSKPEIGREEIQAVIEVMKTDQLALGPKTRAFESEFAKMIGMPFGVAVNSGTSGLHLAVKALNIGPGDRVITTPFSFIASSNCILYENAEPVFVDAEEDTFGLDTSQIDEHIDERTKAILPVHVFGQSCDMSTIMEIATKYGLSVIEDACESPLATHKGKNAGTFGNISVYGFYPNKQMTTGEGGMVLVNDESLYHSIASMRNQGRATNMQWLTHYQLGYNYRISEMTAAIGLEQTKKLPLFIQKRRELAEYYIEKLSDIREITPPHTAHGNEHAWFVFAVRTDHKLRDDIILELNEAGIQSKAYFSPCIHLQDFYKEKFGYREGMFPVAEKLSAEMLILPFYNQIKKEEIDYIVMQLKKILTRLR